MPILGLLVIVIYFLFKSASESAESKERCAKLVNQGAFLKRDYEKHRMIRQDFNRDWNCGERKHFPKEYHEYFERNSDAKAEFVSALTSAQEIREGRQPILCVGLYNKNTYSPFSRFDYLYRDKIKIFNDTEVYYF